MGERQAEIDSIRDIRWTSHGLNNGFVFTATYAGVRRLPLGFSYAVGRLGTWLAWRLWGEGTRALADNLSAVLPAAGEAERIRLARRTLLGYARNTIDFIHALELPAAGLMARLHSLDRAAIDALRAEGRGVLVVTGHFGNWELGAVLLRKLCGAPLSVVSMTEPSPGVNRIRRRMRDSLDVDTIEIRQGMATAMQIRAALADNRAVAMLLDRHLGRDRVQVEFLGRRAWFLRTPALLGYWTGAPLLPSFLAREPDGKFTSVLGTPIRVDAAREPDEAVALATQDFARQLEAQIRRWPDQWYQFYPYWAAQADPDQKAAW